MIYKFKVFKQVTHTHDPTMYSSNAFFHLMSDLTVRVVGEGVQRLMIYVHPTFDTTSVTLNL